MFWWSIGKHRKPNFLELKPVVLRQLRAFTTENMDFIGKSIGIVVLILQSRHNSFSVLNVWGGFDSEKAGFCSVQ